MSFFSWLAVSYQTGGEIVRHEGRRSLLKEAFRYFWGRLFRYGRYYLYEKEVNPDIELTESERNISGLTLEIISSLPRFDQLVAQGYDLSLTTFVPKLERGAVGFGIFDGKELVSITWLALDERAKRQIDYLPYKVKYKYGEVCSGAALTKPSHRGKGLLSYNYSYIFPFLAQNGVSKFKFSIGVHNLASQRAYEKINPKITGTGRYFRIFSWELWREETDHDISL